MPLPDRAFAGQRGEKASPSAVNIRGRQRGSKVRCYGKPMHRRDQDVCHSCPALHDDKVSQAVHGSAFKHIQYSARGSAIKHVASARVRPILGHLLLCCENQHPCSLLKRYSFVCLFNATSNLIPDHRKIEPIISSCRAYSTTCRKSLVEGSLEDVSSALYHAMPIGCLSAVPAGLRENPNSDLPQE